MEIIVFVAIAALAVAMRDQGALSERHVARWGNVRRYGSESSAGRVVAEA